MRSYWAVRMAQSDKQLAGGKADAGTRGAVTGGKHLDALTDLIEEIFLDCGFPASSISRGSRVELPGYFRPEKKWDLVVVHEDTVAAAIELKSQVGPSFGNNFNNRVEEAIGSALDIWTAHREGRFGLKAPWLGYIFLLEECQRSTQPVKSAEPFFEIDPIFKCASYKKRYEILCTRLVLERHYNAACFATSSSDPSTPINEPSDDLSFAAFVAAIRGRATELRISA